MTVRMPFWAAAAVALVAQLAPVATADTRDQRDRLDPAAPPATLRVLTRDQAELLRTGRVRVAVTARRTARLRLIATTPKPVPGPKARVVTGARDVRMRAGSRRTVSLPLRPRSRRIFQSCGGLLLSARAAARGSRRRVTTTCQLLEYPPEFREVVLPQAAECRRRRAEDGVRPPGPALPLRVASTTLARRSVGCGR